MRFAVLASLALGAVTLPAPVLAAERGLTVQDFDGVRVEGPFSVEVTTGRGSGGRIVGEARALDAVRADVEGGTLVVRADERTGWDGKPPVVRLTTSAVTRATVSGPGVLVVDHMRGMSLRAVVDGAGQLRVKEIAGDSFEAVVAGTGTLTLAGKAGNVALDIRGSGVIEAGALVAADAKLGVDGSGAVTVFASRSAGITAKGTGVATVYGKPACTVKREGSAQALCGMGKPAALAEATTIPDRATLPQVRVGVPPQLMRRASRAARP